MGKPVVLQQRFMRMVQDAPRYSLPTGACWNLVDYLPDLQANVRKRGGWSYASNDISAAGTGASYVTLVGYAPFSGGAKLCAMTDNSRFVTIAAGSLVVSVVSTGGIQSLQPPIFHADKLIILGNDGSQAPKYYDGTTFGALAGSPPAGKYGTAYKDRTVIGNTAAHQTYTYFSSPSSPTTWDLTNTWISTLRPPTGYASLPGALMIFQDAVTSRVRGSTPPAGLGIGGDFVIDDPIFNIGCTDARSIAIDGPFACFANPGGVYMTNGTNLPVDLTKQAGIKKLWNDRLAGYSTSGWTLAGGIYRRTYFVVAMNGANFIDAFWFDMESFAAGRMSNFPGIMFSAATQIVEELYFASRFAPRVDALSTIFSPTSANKNDANGIAVEPILETPFFLDTASGAKTWTYLIPEYDLRDAATDNPQIQVSYIRNPDDTYTVLTPSLFSTTTDKRGPKIDLGFAAQGLGLKLEQVNPSSDTRLVALSADVHAREPSRTF